MGNNTIDNTTIEIDRKTHAKIKTLQISKEKEHERPVSIKEIVRDAVNCYLVEVKGN